MTLSPFLQRTRRLALQPFIFPLAAPARIATIGVDFRAASNLRRFSMFDGAALCSWTPDALVLPLGAALTLADRRKRGALELPALSTAIVVLTSFAETPLDLHHREELWRVFGVPVFEQLRGWDGHVIARECEVHDGLHIDQSRGPFRLQRNELLAPLQLPVRTGLSGKIVTAHCECGAETPRLCDLVRLEREPVDEPAAAA